MVIDIGHSIGQALVHIGGYAGERCEPGLVGAKVYHRCSRLAVLHFAVPRKIQLGLIFARGQRHLGVVRGDGCP